MQKKNHQEILGDLMEIRNRAAEVWQKIGLQLPFLYSQGH